MAPVTIVTFNFPLRMNEFELSTITVVHHFFFTSSKNTVFKCNRRHWLCRLFVGLQGFLVFVKQGWDHDRVHFQHEWWVSENILFIDFQPSLFTVVYFMMGTKSFKESERTESREAFTDTKRKAEINSRRIVFINE